MGSWRKSKTNSQAVMLTEEQAVDLTKFLPEFGNPDAHSGPCSPACGVRALFNELKRLGYSYSD